MANWAQWRENIFLTLPAGVREKLQNNLVQRCIAGVVLALTSLWAIWLAPNVFPLYVWLFILLAVREWQRMTEPDNWRQSVDYLYSVVLLLAIVQALFSTTAALAMLVLLPFLLWLIGAQMNLRRPLWFAASIIYLALPALALIHMHERLTIGAAAVTYFLGVVWATDTAAYLIGRKVGGYLLAPDVSPKKTWSGLVGGLMAGGLVGVILGLMLDTQHFLETLLISLILSAAAQGSDLAQSAAKRFFSIKDTGGMIPGHGGILDRIDSLMLSAPLYLFLQLCASRPLPW